MQFGRDIVEYFLIFNTEFSYQLPFWGLNLGNYGN